MGDENKTVLDSVLLLHMYCAGSLDGVYAVEANEHYASLIQKLASWQEPTSNFDFNVKQLIQASVDEYLAYAGGQDPC